MRHAFGDCVLDRDRRELTCRGSVVHTSPKLLALLELLIDAAPRAVPKNEIHTSLWPETFVSDATLTSLVADLRTAIGDDARSPRFLKTIHGYGYAFYGEVTADTRPLGHDEGDSRSFRIIAGEREIALSRGEHLLGRATDASVFVDGVGVSRHHARITIGAHGARLEDLGSKNGTILDGRRLDSPEVLADAALIVLGSTALKFRIFEALRSTETVTPSHGR